MFPVLPALTRSFNRLSTFVTAGDRCWGTGALSEQRSWILCEGSRRGQLLEFTSPCGGDEDETAAVAPATNTGTDLSRSAKNKRSRGRNDAVAETFDRTQLYAEISQLLPQDAAAFDVRVFLMLYGESGRGLRTHAHAEAVVEIIEHEEHVGTAGRNGGDTNSVVLKMGYFLDQLSVMAVSGKRVTKAWPSPGYTEPGYIGSNVLLAPASRWSMGFSGWSRDHVDEALRRTLNHISHRYNQGYAKIPQPDEYNCFAYSLTILSIWVGGSCPLFSFGALRTICCLGGAHGVGREAWAAAMLMMLLQLPQPFNYAFGQLERVAYAAAKELGQQKRSLAAKRAEAGAEEEEVEDEEEEEEDDDEEDGEEDDDDDGEEDEEDDVKSFVLLVALFGIVESMCFVGTLVWLVSKLLLSNNFGLIAAVSLLLVTPLNAPWMLR